jgi:aspartate kinase
MGWQLPIRTSGHAAALIEGIDAQVLERVFDEGGIAVIPGFQGVSDAGDLTTLGRGGSDTSAVALAAAMKADRCDIYTDVDGVYTTDPRIVPRARKLPIITFEEMLELASVGPRCCRPVQSGSPCGRRCRSAFCPPSMTGRERWS